MQNHKRVQYLTCCAKLCIYAQEWGKHFKASGIQSGTTKHTVRSTHQSLHQGQRTWSGWLGVAWPLLKISVHVLLFRVPKKLTLLPLQMSRPLFFFFFFFFFFFLQLCHGICKGTSNVSMFGVCDQLHYMHVHRNVNFHAWKQLPLNEPNYR